MNRLGDNRDWMRFQPYNGIRQRAYELWLVFTGRNSFHRAWQLGMEYGARNEYARLIYNGAAETELKAYQARVERSAAAGQAMSNPFINLSNAPGSTVMSDAQMADAFAEVMGDE